MLPQEVLKRPLITERTSELSERFNQIAFEVAPTASKSQVRNAVETIYGVNVDRVRTMIVPGKLKRRGTDIGRTSKWKKALVTLKEGEVIDFFAEE